MPSRSGGLVGGHLFGSGFRECGDEGVEQFARQPSVNCRHRPRIAEPEAEELMRVDLALLAVDLVGDDHHGNVAPLQHFRDACVFFGDPGRDVDDEQHEIRAAHRGLGLGRHLGRERGRLGREAGLARSQPASGVDEHERAPVPFGNQLAPIARDAGPLFHDRGALTDDPVHERRLADVGAPDHRDARHDSGIDHVSLIAIQLERARRRRSRRPRPGAATRPQSRRRGSNRVTASRPAGDSGDRRAARRARPRRRRPRATR